MVRKVRGGICCCQDGCRRVDLGGRPGLQRSRKVHLASVCSVSGTEKSSPDQSRSQVETPSLSLSLQGFFFIKILGVSAKWGKEKGSQGHWLSLTTGFCP